MNNTKGSNDPTTLNEFKKVNYGHRTACFIRAVYSGDPQRLQALLNWHRKGETFFDTNPCVPNAHDWGNVLLMDDLKDRVAQGDSSLRQVIKILQEAPEKEVEPIPAEKLMGFQTKFDSIMQQRDTDAGWEKSLPFPPRNNSYSEDTLFHTGFPRNAHSMGQSCF